MKVQRQRPVAMLIDKDNQQGLSTSGHIGHPIGEQTKIQGVKGNATQVNLTLMTKD